MRPIRSAPRHVVVFCPIRDEYAQAVAEALFTATAIADDMTVIQGDLMLPPAADRQGAGLTLIDLGGLQASADRHGRWQRDLSTRLQHASEAGGDVMVLLALPVEPAGEQRNRAEDLAALRFAAQAAARFPSLRIEPVSVGRAGPPLACAQRLIAALAGAGTD